MYSGISRSRIRTISGVFDLSGEQECHRRELWRIDKRERWSVFAATWTSGTMCVSKIQCGHQAAVRCSISATADLDLSLIPVDMQKLGMRSALAKKKGKIFCTVFVTGNAGKLREVKAILLQGAPIEITSQALDSGYQSLLALVQ